MGLLVLCCLLVGFDVSCLGKRHSVPGDAEYDALPKGQTNNLPTDSVVGGCQDAAKCMSTCMPRIAKYRHNAKAAVSYTFDDGLSEHYTIVMPMLDSLGIKGTFWIVGRNIEIRKKMREAESMTWEQVKTMGNHGHEIASHGYTHTNFKKLSFDGIDREIDLNDSVIFLNTGFHPQTLGYPGNSKTDSIVRYVEAHKGIVATRTRQQSVGGTRMRSVADINAWLQRSIDRGEWAVGMTHGIRIGYDHFATDGILSQHLLWARTMKDEGLLWIGTFLEVASYLRGLSVEVTYILDAAPKSVIQDHQLLVPYKSWDGTWCVDGKRGVPLRVDYCKAGEKK